MYISLSLILSEKFLAKHTRQVVGALDTTNTTPQYTNIEEL